MTVNIASLLQAMGGINLDIACGASKQPGNWVGIDVQPFPGVDIVHDLAVIPWPLPDGCVSQAVASHIVEHIPKTIQYMGEDGKFHTYNPFIAFMDEVWRILKNNGTFAIAVPHGSSQGFIQDPTHASPLNPATWAYFDPSHPFYHFYSPKPWKVKAITYDPVTNMEVVLTKRAIEPEHIEKATISYE